MGFQRTKGGKVARFGGKQLPRWKEGDPVEIKFGPIKCQFVSSYPKKLDYTLTAPYPGYFFMPEFKAGKWDGHYHFITKSHYFPTGLLPAVYAILRTGCNPLRENEKVLKVLPKRVKLHVPPEGREFFNPNFLRHYMDEPDLLENLTEEEGTFSVPRISLIKLKDTRQKNVFSAKLLELFKSIRIKNLGK
jgi:hypothetical protein